jgi:hypothetical protein
VSAFTSGTEEDKPWTPRAEEISMNLFADLVYAGLAPYEKRVIELLRNSKDKRARKVCHNV